MKDFALGLGLKQRQKATRKWPIKKKWPRRNILRLGSRGSDVKYSTRAYFRMQGDRCVGFTHAYEPSRLYAFMETDKTSRLDTNSQTCLPF